MEVIALPPVLTWSVTTTVLGPFVWDYPDEPVPEGSFTDSPILTEFLNHAPTSSMQSHVDELTQRASNIGMIINVKKTREMLIGRALKVSIPSIVHNSEPIQRVDTFKLLDVHISNDLKWGQHVNVIFSKAASRLHFLKQLKRAVLMLEQTTCFAFIT